MNAPARFPRSAEGERFYSPQLDALRFIAAFLVIVHHAPQVPILAPVKALGFLGVDLFLCISAYLLTRLLQLEIRRTGGLRIRAFFIRRVLRIWPLYFGYAAVMSLAAVVVFGQQPALVAGWLLSHLTFSANLLTAMQGFSPVPFTAHLWTISLEEQAYLVIPLALVALSRTRVSSHFIACSAAAALLLMVFGRVGAWLAGLEYDAIMVLPLRADGIVAGVAAALLVERHGLPGKRLCLWAAALILGGTLAFTALNPMSTLAALVLNPLLVAACLAALLSVVQTRLTWSPMVYLGKISFGIYIYHYLALRASERALERLQLSDPALILAATLLLTFVAAALSYHLFEAPFLRLKERFTVVKSRPV